MPTPARYLIVNADDLGASARVNRGILEAHEQGVVTSASLMVDMPGAQDAASLRQRAPQLSVGLHATLTSEEGELVVEPGESREALERQLQRFEALIGRPPTHLDSHHNVHLEYPVLGEIFGELAAELGVPLRARSVARYYADFYGQWDDGESHPELVSVESLLETLEREVGPGVTELGCHPGYAGDGFESSYLLEREAEVRALCDPRVRERAEALGIELVSFARLAEIAHELEV
ncbi:MAG TPA: ChbG/HpnK family deacetylase, partial [Solirubrobacteraceae bacterium]